MLGWGEDAAVEKGLRTRGLAGAAAAPQPWPAGRPKRRMMPKSGWMAATIPIAPPRCRRAIADLEEKVDRPLYLICGMLRTKDAVGFLSAFKGLARHVVTVAIPGEAASMGAGALYDAARAAGLDAAPAEDLEDAMLQVERLGAGACPRSRRRAF